MKSETKQTIGLFAMFIFMVVITFLDTAIK